MAMGTEPSPADLAAFAEVMEQIERKNAQRLFYDLFPNEGGPGKEGSVTRRVSSRSITPAHSPLTACWATPKTSLPTSWPSSTASPTCCTRATTSSFSDTPARAIQADRMAEEIGEFGYDANRPPGLSVG